MKQYQLWLPIPILTPIHLGDQNRVFVHPTILTRGSSQSTLPFLFYWLLRLNLCGVTILRQKGTCSCWGYTNILIEAQSRDCIALPKIGHFFDFDLIMENFTSPYHWKFTSHQEPWRRCCVLASFYGQPLQPTPVQFNQQLQFAHRKWYLGARYKQKNGQGVSTK